MRGLARFITSGRWQAIVVAGASVMLALLAPPISSPLAYVSGGTIALVGLSQSLLETAGVLLGSAVLIGVLASFVYSGATPVVIAALMLWLPVMFGARILKATNALPHAMLAVTVLAVALVSGMHLAMGDTAAWWEARLEPIMQPIFEQQGLDAAVIQQIAPWVTALLAIALLVGVLLSLLLGRWWQALVYDEGRFGEEFRRLRFGKAVAAVTLLVWGATAFPALPGSMWFRDLGIVLAVPFVFAGLAVVHGLVHKLRLNAGWLVAVYGLMIVASPAAELALSVLGLSDSWLNIRQRASRNTEE